MMMTMMMMVRDGGDDGSYSKLLLQVSYLASPMSDLGVSSSFSFLLLLRQQVGEDNKHHQQVCSTTQPPQTFCKLLTTEMTEIVYYFPLTKLYPPVDMHETVRNIPTTQSNHQTWS